MYIVGKYYQGNPDQKPEQWGSIADVQYAVKHWCEEWLGVDYENLLLACPVWTCLQDYSRNNIKINKYNNPEITKDFIRTTQATGLYLEDSEKLEPKEISLFLQTKISDLDSGDAIFYRTYNYGATAPYISVGFNAKTNNSVYFLSASTSALTNNSISSEVPLNKKMCLLGVHSSQEGRTIYVDGDISASGGPAGDITYYYTNEKTSIAYKAWNNSGFCPQDIYNFYIFSIPFNVLQAQLLSDQPYKLFEPVSRPIYFDVDGVPTNPEYASVISEKVNTISEFQKEGLFSSTISEKTNLISGVQKQAEISSVLAERSNILSIGSVSEEISYSSVVSEKVNIISDRFKQAQTKKTISETTNLEASVKKTGYYASAITEKTNITSTGSSEDIEVHSYSSVISGKTNFETTFFKGAVTDSFISEEINLNSEFYKTSFLNSVVSEPSFFSSEVYKAINYQSIISERVNLISIIAGGLLVRPVLNTSIGIEEDRYSYGIEQ